MTATLTKKESNQKISQFITLFKQGVDAWIKAGEILVDLVESDPHTYDYIIQQCPQINAGILGRFEQMGRKTLHPQLLLTASPGFAKLTRLPFSMQERYISEPIPLIVHTAEGTDVLLVKAKDMTKEQANQVFALGRLRTEGEQKALLMQQQSNAARPVTTSKPWSIRGSKIIINGLEFSRKELTAILAQMD
jgi:hypothetical protein